jgi:hypothetical protein
MTKLFSSLYKKKCSSSIAYIDLESKFYFRKFSKFSLYSFLSLILLKLIKKFSKISLSLFSSKNIKNFSFKKFFTSS